MKPTHKLSALSNIDEKSGKKYYSKIGIASVNEDGSVKFLINWVPVRKFWGGRISAFLDDEIREQLGDSTQQEKQIVLKALLNIKNKGEPNEEKFYGRIGIGYIREDGNMSLILNCLPIEEHWGGSFMGFINEENEENNEIDF